MYNWHVVPTLYDFISSEEHKTFSSLNWSFFFFFTKSQWMNTRYFKLQKGCRSTIKVSKVNNMTCALYSNYSYTIDLSAWHLKGQFTKWFYWPSCCSISVWLSLSSVEHKSYFEKCLNNGSQWSPKMFGFKHSSKYFLLCSAYRLVTTWGWVNDSGIYILGVNYTLGNFYW